MNIDDDVEEEVKYLKDEADSINEEAESEKQFLEAEAIYRHALSIACSNFIELEELVWLYTSYGNLQTDLNDHEIEVLGREPNIRRECEATRYFEEALKISRHLSKDGDELSVFALSAVLNDFGRCCFFFDYHKRAESLFDEALKIRRKWSGINPKLWMEFYSNTLWNYAIMQPYLDEPEKEVAILEEALQVFSKLEKQEPGKYENELQEIRERLCEINQ